MTSQTSPSNRTPIRASDHALDRARERYGELRHLTHQQLASRVTREVGEAVRDGRKAKTAPRFACLTGDVRRKINGTARFAWTADQHRVYVVKPKRDGGYLVVTTLATVTSRV